MKKATAVFAVTFLAGLWRLRDHLSPTLWAEDGDEFLPTSTMHGPFHWFDPYGGYLHVIPRILADFVRVFVPFDHWPVAVTLLAVGVAAGLCTLAWWASAAHIQQESVRLAVALTPMLVPGATVEVLGNFANLHWFALWACGWLLLAQPQSARQRRVATFAVLMCALTEIQVVLLAPLMVIGWRSRISRPQVIAALVGLTLQFSALVFGPARPVRDDASFTWFDVVAGFLGNVMTASLRPHLGPVVLGLLAMLVWATCVGWVARRGTPGERGVVVVLALASVGLWLAAILANHGDGIDYANLPDWSLVVVRRYGFVPSVAVLMVFAVALGRAARIRPVLARTAGACLLILVIASGWDAPFTRNGLTPWPTRAEIADQCQGSSTRVLKVPIAPEGWIARVPCHLA